MSVSVEWFSACLSVVEWFSPCLSVVEWCNITEISLHVCQWWSTVTWRNGSAGSGSWCLRSYVWTWVRQWRGCCWTRCRAHWAQSCPSGRRNTSSRWSGWMLLCKAANWSTPGSPHRYHVCLHLYLLFSLSFDHTHCFSFCCGTTAGTTVTYIYISGSSIYIYWSFCIYILEPEMFDIYIYTGTRNVWWYILR